tara:strand:- start:355 stop:978 length:624 start_codon:yes stop_codon:yes gene_type:complete
MIGSIYNKYVVPKLLDVCCSTKPIKYQRNKIVPYAKGEVLEIGIGSGLNLPYYNKSLVKKVYGLDPSEELNEIALKNASEINLDINFIISGAEQIKLPSKSIDTVLITYTLCTIPEFKAALKEIKRVLKDDGIMLFCEHGLAPDKKVSKWQNRINPLWGKLFGGCNINRNIPHIIQESGLNIKKLEQMYLPSTPKIVAYNYWGVASQ